MIKPLTFQVTINAPVARVWDSMLDPEPYRVWTSVFTTGSHYTGSWDKGATIRFLDPNRSGMLAEIAENRRHEFISIRHLGMIDAGVEDTTSESVRAWAPAYENYTFRATPEGTEVTVTVDVAGEWEQMMLDKYPKALAKLKALCEGALTA